MTMTSPRSGLRTHGMSVPPAEMIHDAVLKAAIANHERVRGEFNQTATLLREAEGAVRAAEKADLRRRAGAIVDGAVDPGFDASETARRELAALVDRRALLEQALDQAASRVSRAIGERGPDEVLRIGAALDDLRTRWLALLDEVEATYGRVRALAATRNYLTEEGRRGFKLAAIGLDDRVSVDQALSLLRELIAAREVPTDAPAHDEETTA